MPTLTHRRLHLDQTKMAECIQRLAAEIAKAHPNATNLALVGIHKRGVPLAYRIAHRLRTDHDLTCVVGTIDITQYRDDLGSFTILPRLEGSDIPFDIDDAPVVLCDEVLFTGRSVRAAIDALMDFGRPRCVELATLIDRDGREFPIQPTYCGDRITLPADQRVAVRFVEIEDDNEDAVYIESAPLSQA
ncbi:MAG: bifunctional pyr operon transcriptional regulator/uracil phosphoribosyltransferase PyrR [Verrucomicrobiales bacterium]|nr:bifunctional pyr operon transcriptional regulator/uracil phosphoribosyltransferase PyrR [Verrucomicrobiales bacterium]MCP5558257.1 bifunctional pyr operon transcriptional regulator/uracil phosphoribosyltransferase PyrR [Verrucomicrobiaceae bacterium]